VDNYTRGQMEHMNGGPLSEKTVGMYERVRALCDKANGPSYYPLFFSALILELSREEKPARQRKAKDGRVDAVAKS